MVQHIVMWKFKPEIKEEEKPTLKENMKKNLLGLKEVIPEILDCKFVDAPLGTSTHDMALIINVNCPNCLKKYSESPLHQNVANTYVRPFVEQRAALDYYLE